MARRLGVACSQRGDAVSVPDSTAAPPLGTSIITAMSGEAEVEVLLEAVRHGSMDAVELALRKAAVHVNRLGATGATALHMAVRCLCVHRGLTLQSSQGVYITRCGSLRGPPQVWRNHAGIVSQLLGAGATPDIRDAESGW